MFFGKHSVRPLSLRRRRYPWRLRLLLRLRRADTSSSSFPFSPLLPHYLRQTEMIPLSRSLALSAAAASSPALIELAN